MSSYYETQITAHELRLILATSIRVK